MEKYPLLNRINSPADLKNMDAALMPELAREIRRFLVENVTETGGHLASNLGVVELSIALHRVFDTPKDHIIFDVGHQSYVHKLLTGRRDGFGTLRKPGGLSGFTRRAESEHDAFGAGHSSTAISAAVGFAEGDRISGNDAFSVAVVGDGAFTGGMVHEALNNCRGDLKLIVILNENEMSISKNTGAFANHIAKIRSSPSYMNTKSRTGSFLSGIPLVGEPMYAAVRDTKKFFKNMIFSSNYFEEMGLFYLGPANGNDYFAVERLLRAAKEKGESVILHLKTVKGKGYAPAEQNPREFHGIPPRGTPSVRNFSAEMGAWLTDAAEKDKNICAITASMAHSTGLSPFSKAHPRRFFDVGIAEEHAATFAAGLAAQGKKPFFAVYSSFLQRSYDSVIHDIGLQSLGVVLCVDRAGLASADGPTHHGILDVSFLSQVRDMRIYAPVTFASLRNALEEARLCHSPCAVRYPNCGEVNAEGFIPTDHPMIKTSFENGESCDALIITYGKIVTEAQKAADALNSQGIKTGIVLMEQIAPVCDLAPHIAPLLENCRCAVYLEEGVLGGGAGMMLFDELCRRYGAALNGKNRSVLAVRDPFVRGKLGESIYETAGISAKDTVREVEKLLSL
ncbi:MAG: 1-deoxy-D-xylulose-5-phosphate synthase [Ruminococcaceae bacterium]|nr:1-deoxy-D-xylulose-5-phosphate synthase [Oscillospiraceae bacterium]